MTTWKQLTIYISESDCWQHQPLYQALLGIARQQKLTGVTMIRAIAASLKEIIEDKFVTRQNIEVF
jgi:PII-like signaling protein